MKSRKRKNKNRKALENKIFQEMRENGLVNEDAQQSDWKLRDFIEFDNTSDIGGLGDIQNVISILDQILEENPDGNVSVEFDPQMTQRFKDLKVKSSFSDIKSLSAELNEIVCEAYHVIDSMNQITPFNRIRTV